jgi:F0F1-type ATP synthase epsilon subunit
MIATLKAGNIEITEDSNNKQTFPVKGGVVEVLKNKVIVLAE